MIEQYFPENCLTSPPHHVLPPKELLFGGISLGTEFGYDFTKSYGLPSCWLNNTHVAGLFQQVGEWRMRKLNYPSEVIQPIHQELHTGSLWIASGGSLSMTFVNSTFERLKQTVDAWNRMLQKDRKTSAALEDFFKTLSEIDPYTLLFPHEQSHWRKQFSIMHWDHLELNGLM